MGNTCGDARQDALQVKEEPPRWPKDCDEDHGMDRSVLLDRMQQEDRSQFQVFRCGEVSYHRVWRLQDSPQFDSPSCCGGRLLTRTLYFPISAWEAETLHEQGLEAMMSRHRPTLGRLKMTPIPLHIHGCWPPSPPLDMNEKRRFSTSTAPTRIAVASVSGWMRTHHTQDATRAAQPTNSLVFGIDRWYVYHSDPGCCNLGPDGGLFGKPSPIVWVHPSNVTAVTHVVEYRYKCTSHHNGKKRSCQEGVHD